MARATVLGISEYGFTDEKTGEFKEGLTIHILESLESYNGLTAKGFKGGKVSIQKKNAELYTKMLNKDYTKQFEADFIYDHKPGKKYSVLSDIR